MRKLLHALVTVFLVVVTIVAVFFLVDRLRAVLPREIAMKLPDISLADIPDLKEVQKKVVAVAEKVETAVTAPQPLRVPFRPQSAAMLTRYGVIQATNDERVTFGLPTVIENGALNRAAELKLADLFAKQYFEHVSPDGFGPSHWVEAAGYKYRLIGENLALGDFTGDEDLVAAWMASPGHRENILKPQFQEIGVAVGKGDFEGQETWAAVQVFARALPDCPAPDMNLKAQIDAYGDELNALSARIQALRREIDEKHATGDPAQAEVKEHNRLVEEYNAIAKNLKNAVAAYNETVNAYNSCIRG